MEVLNSGNRSELEMQIVREWVGGCQRVGGMVNEATEEDEITLGDEK